MPSPRDAGHMLLLVLREMGHQQILGEAGDCVRTRAQSEPPMVFRGSGGMTTGDTGKRPEGLYEATAFSVFVLNISSLRCGAGASSGTGRRLDPETVCIVLPNSDHVDPQKERAMGDRQRWSPAPNSLHVSPKK